MLSNPSSETTDSGLLSDLSTQFASTAMQKLGTQAQLTNLTFPAATVPIRFYAEGNLKDKVFGEMESTAIKVDSAFKSIVNTMGATDTLGASIRENFSKAVASVQLIGYDFKDVQATAEATLEVFGRNVQLTDDEYTNLLATQKVTGVGVKELETGFLNSGKSIKDITSTMYEVTQIASAIGINAKTVSKTVVDNLDKLNRFGFQNGVEGLARMAAKAQGLRIEFKTITDFADKLFSPEKAIETAATLQRLGATSANLLDPLKLMDMAQNDVGALTNELGNLFSSYVDFDEKTKEFKILPGARGDIRALSEELGIPVDQIEKMAIGTKDLEKKLSEISFAGFDVDEDTKNLVANMSKMNDEGEYTIQYVGADGKPVEQTVGELMESFRGDTEGLKEVLGRQQEEDKKSIEQKMYDRAGEQLTSLQTIAAQNNAAMSALGLAMGGGELGKQVLVANETIAKNIADGFIKQLGPSSSIATSINELAKNNKDAFDVLTGKKEGDKGQAVKDVLKGLERVGLDIITQAGAAIGTIGTNISNTFGIDISGINFSGITEGVENAKKSLNSLSESAIVAGKSLISNIGTANLGDTSMTETEVQTQSTTNQINEINNLTEPTPVGFTDVIINQPKEEIPIGSAINPTFGTESEGISVNMTSPSVEGTIGSNVLTSENNEEQGTQSSENVGITRGVLDTNRTQAEINEKSLSTGIIDFSQVALFLNNVKDSIQTGVDQIMSSEGKTKEEKLTEVREYMAEYTKTFMQPLMEQNKGLLGNLYNVSNISTTTALNSGGFDPSKMMIGPAEASTSPVEYDFSQFKPFQEVFQNTTNDLINNKDNENTDNLILLEENFTKITNELLNYFTKPRIESNLSVQGGENTSYEETNISNLFKSINNPLEVLGMTSNDFFKLLVNNSGLLKDNMTTQDKFLTEIKNSNQQTSKTLTNINQNSLQENINTSEQSNVFNEQNNSYDEMNKAMNQISSNINESSVILNSGYSEAGFPKRQEPIRYPETTQIVNPSAPITQSPELTKGKEEKGTNDNRVATFLSEQRGQSFNISENRTLDVNVSITGSKDPETERKLRETIINTVRDEMTVGNRTRQQIQTISNTDLLSPYNSTQLIG